MQQRTNPICQILYLSSWVSGKNNCNLWIIILKKIKIMTMIIMITISHRKLFKIYKIKFENIFTSIHYRLTHLSEILSGISIFHKTKYHYYLCFLTYIYHLEILEEYWFENKLPNVRLESLTICTMPRNSHCKERLSHIPKYFH